MYPSRLCLGKQKQFNDAQHFGLNYQVEEVFIRGAHWKYVQIRGQIEPEYTILIRIAQRRITITGWVPVGRTGFMLCQLDLCGLKIAM